MEKTESINQNIKLSKIKKIAINQNIIHSKTATIAINQNIIHSKTENNFTQIKLDAIISINQNILSKNQSKLTKTVHQKTHSSINNTLKKDKLQ